MPAVRAVLAALLALAAVLALCGPADASALIVTVDGVRNGAGEISLGLYASEADWPRGRPLAHIVLPAAPGRLTYTFQDLKPGRYALSGFHDENDNGVFDTNVFGLPKEGFVFSRDCRPRFRPPAFDDCTIDLTQAPAAITVHVQYWGTAGP